MMSSDPAPRRDQNPGPIRRLDLLAQPIENFANLAAALAIFSLMVLGVFQIVLRTVFNAPITGYIDMVELSMASMAFLGAAYCQRLGAHIRMEILIGRLKGRWIWAAEVIGTALAIFIVVVLIWYSWGHFLRAFLLGDTTIDAEFPVWPSKLLVPIAFSVWLLRLFIQFAGSVRLFFDPTLAPEGVVTIKDQAEHAQVEIHEAIGALENNDIAKTDGPQT